MPWLLVYFQVPEYDLVIRRDRSGAFAIVRIMISLKKDDETVLKKFRRRRLMPEIQVKGMSCGHCVAAMTKAMNSLAGVSNVQVDLASGRVIYDSTAPIPQEDLDRVVKMAGFELVSAG